MAEPGQDMARWTGDDIAAFGRLLEERHGPEHGAVRLGNMLRALRILREPPE